MTVDIHAHVVPGLDDGPRTFAEADALLRNFREAGVDDVICTPHYLHPLFDLDLITICTAFDDLVEVTPPDDAWPHLHLGAEVRLTKALIDDLRWMTVPTLAGTSSVLVELPSRGFGDAELELIHELVVRGYQPILAHPERNLSIQKQPERVRDLTRLGVRMQLTASAVIAASQNAEDRTFGRAPKSADSPTVRTAQWIIAHGYADFVASDAHDTVLRTPCDAKWLCGIELSREGCTRA